MYVAPIKKLMCSRPLFPLLILVCLELVKFRSKTARMKVVMP